MLARDLLVRAVEHDDGPAIDRALCAAACADELCIDGRPLFYHACGAGRAAAVERLLLAGVDAERRTDEGMHPLGAAAQNNHVAVLRAYARHRPLPALAFKAATLLDVACSTDALDVARYLVEECGACIQPPAPYESSPLALTCIFCSHACMRYLLDTGRVDVNARSVSGKTPLYLSIHRNCAAAVQLLLERGADARALMPRARTLLMAACEFADVDVVRLIAQAGADAEARTAKGYRALTFACQSGRLAVVRYMLERSAVVAPLDCTWRELRVAVRSGHADVAAHLMQHPAYGENRGTLHVTHDISFQTLTVLLANLERAPGIRTLVLPRAANVHLSALSIELPTTWLERLEFPTAWFGRPGADALADVLNITRIRSIAIDEPQFADLVGHPALDWRRRVDAAGPWTPGVHRRYPLSARVRIVNVLLCSRVGRSAPLHALSSDLLLVLLAAVARLNYR